MEIEDISITSTWRTDIDIFNRWLDNRHAKLEPGLVPQPSIKVLVFLALLDSEQPLTYENIREIFQKKKIIKGKIPNNTLRTSVLNLSKTLDKFNHDLQIKSSRGLFQLIKRIKMHDIQAQKITYSDPVVLLLDPPAIKAEEVACALIEKAVLPLPGLYFLEW